MNFLFSIQVSRINNDTVGECSNPPGAQTLAFASCCSVNSGLSQTKCQWTLFLLIKHSAAGELADSVTFLIWFIFSPQACHTVIHTSWHGALKGQAQSQSYPRAMGALQPSIWLSLPKHLQTNSIELLITLFQHEALRSPFPNDWSDWRSSPGQGVPSMSKFSGLLTGRGPSEVELSAL